MAKPSGKICVFCHNLEINGANLFVVSLIRAIRSEVAQIVIYSPRPGKVEERLSPYANQIKIIGGEFDFDNLTQFDLVVVNSLFMSRVVLECTKRAVPNVLIVHETWYIQDIDFYIRDLWNSDSVSPEQVVKALQQSKKVVFPAKYLSTVYEGLVSPDRMATIYCTIDMTAIDEFKKNVSRAQARENLEIGSRVVYLQVGTITRRKAQLNTVKAFAEVVQSWSGNEKPLLILLGARRFRPGEAEYIGQIERFIDKNNLNELVRLVPVLENPFPYFRAADVLVHPSINEVLPLAILEACYFSIPVIASNLDGMPEVIRHQHNGLLVSPFSLRELCDAMIVLGENIDLRCQYGESAKRIIIKNHSVNQFNDQYSSLITELVR